MIWMILFIGIYCDQGEFEYFIKEEILKEKKNKEMLSDFTLHCVSKAAHAWNH